MEASIHCLFLCLNSFLLFDTIIAHSSCVRSNMSPSLGPSVVDNMMLLFGTVTGAVDDSVIAYVSLT